MPHPTDGKTSFFGFPDPGLYAESFEKEIIKKIEYSRNLPDHENY